MTDTISSDLIAKYQAANYQVIVGSNVITLHIGQYSPSLHQLLIKTAQPCALSITAFNPFSQQQEPSENLIRNTQLHKVLIQYTNLIFKGASIDPVGLWPDEESFLALGINLETAKRLGQQFNQNAIVWIDSDAIPQLVLLR